MLRLMSFVRSSASQSRFIRGTVSLFPPNTSARNNSSDNNKIFQKPEVVPKDSVTKSNPEEEEYKVTLAIYSGRPNPSWTVHSSHGSFQSVKEHHEKAKAASATYCCHQMPAKLGFKGFLLRTNGTEYHHLIKGNETADLQQLLFNTIPKKLLADTLYQNISRVIGSDVEDVVPKQSLEVTPPPDLDKWNNVSYTRRKNNCYNYGRDIITNTFAQPGRGSGHLIEQITVAEVLQAAECDGVTLLPCQPRRWEPCPTDADVPDGQSLVALVVDPYNDYHWYRLDSNKYWSHKPGDSLATDLDGNGNHIPDPRYAANSPNGPDYRFVAFMTTNRNVIA